MLTDLVRPMPPDSLGLTRIVIGVAALIRSIVALPLLLELTQPELIKITVFEWMPEPSAGLAWTLVAIWAVSALLLTIGWKVPICGLILLGSLIFMLCLDLQTYSNHLYLMTWLVLLLVVADSGAGRSIERRPREVARWTLLLIMLQISIVYGFSGITKLNDEFLTGGVLGGVLDGGLVPFPDVLRTPELLGTLAVVTVLVEVFLAFGLWIPRYRTIAIVLGIGLHISITLLLSDTGELLVFSLLMVSTYPLFIQVRPLSGSALGRAATAPATP